MLAFWKNLGLGAQIAAFAGATMLVLVAVLLTGYAYQARDSVIAGEVAKARGLVLMAESAREQMAEKWEKGIFSTDKVRQWARQAETKEQRKDMVLSAVPVVTAWRTAQAKAEEAGFEFKPIRENPRNADHSASEVEMRAIRYFRNNPGADEFHFVDEQANAVRYFRPVRLGEVCMNCHGDPDRSQALWGRTDGKDITGHKMEDKEVGDLHGAFEVILPLDKANATITANLWGGVLTGLLLLAAALGALYWGIQRAICRPIHTTVDRVGQITEQGDLTLRTPESGIREMGRLGHTFNSFLDKLAGLFGDWRSQSSQLASASEELSATADEISRNAQASTKRVEEVASSAQEVNQVVQDVAKNISEVSESASQSTGTTKEGMKAVEQASERINKLKASGERVDEIMETIQAIAKKTDLLALNAAIEAANAGEQGKGFAVVADEVRKLAEQTSEATGQVSEVVSDVRSHSDSSVTAMNQVQEKMTEVLRMIEHTDATANQIASAAEELAATMSETTDNIGEVSSNVEQVSDSVTQIEEAAQQLGDLAYSLQQALGQFRLEAGESAQAGSQGVDFQRAKTDHYAWKTKLRNLLDGKEGLSEQEATSHEHCRLGRWIYSEGMDRYGARKEMQELEEAHKALHQSVKEVIQLKNRGQNDAAEQEYAHFEEHSDRVVRLLDRLAASS